ncbi:MAG TPA: Ig-like domain-containing protein, partial [Nannocystaceae bacterium]|nr:Ig-like domain-containing protein [Nannocystaceae bacterium]
VPVTKRDDPGLGQSRGLPRPVPPEAPRLRAAPRTAAAGQAVIFVNFDGAQLSSGWDDSTNDVTQIGECAGSFAAYGDGPKRDAVMQAVVGDWAAYGVLVTDERPASGDYTMNMTGPSNPFGGGVLGIAPLDCDDEQTPNNITFAFHSLNDGFDASTTATTIGQEVAHSFGLEHVDDPDDIMNPFNAGGDPSFRDECLPIVQGGSCPSQHQAQCGSGYSQNSHQELLALFGPSMPDTQQPTVAITFPLDGQEFDAGAEFFLMVDAADDVGVQGVTLWRDGAAMGDDGASPFGFQVSGLGSGVYEFYAVAVDAAGNETHSDTVTIGIGEAPPPPHMDDGGDTGDDAGDDAADDATDGGANDGDDAADDADAGDDANGDTALPPGFGLAGENDGCGCRTTIDRRGVALGLALVVVWRRRPKRRSSALG